MDRARKHSAGSETVSIMHPKRKEEKTDKVRQIFEEDWHTGWEGY